MKRVLFYIAVIVIVILFFTSHGTIASILVVLLLLLSARWIHTSYREYQQIKDLISDRITFNKIQRNYKKVLKNLEEILVVISEKLTAENLSSEKEEALKDLSSKLEKDLSFMENEIKVNIELQQESEYAALYPIYQIYKCYDLLFYYQPPAEVKKSWKLGIEKMKAGTFMVKLEKVYPSLKIELIKSIKNSTNLSLRQAKNKVDTVIAGHTETIEENINETHAITIKEIIELFGGVASIIDCSKKEEN